MARKKAKTSGATNKKLPLNQSIPLGIQHVFAMFAGNITVPLIVAGVFGVTTGEKIFLIQMALFAAGVATIIQTVGYKNIGARLPIIEGTSFAFAKLFGDLTLTGRFEPMRNWEIPGLSSIPGVGAVLFDQSPLVYLSVVLIWGIWYLLNRTTFGLAVRAVGDRPAAADAAGISVNRTRWIAILVSGAMAGLGGQAQAMGQSDVNQLMGIGGLQQQQAQRYQLL